jgi:hypothetical protein
MLGVSGARLDFALIHWCCSCRCHWELLLFEEAKKFDDGSRLLQVSRHLKRPVVA